MKARRTRSGHASWCWSAVHGLDDALHECVAGTRRRRARHGVGPAAGHVELADAGFGDVQVREVESDPLNYYYVARK